MGVKHDWKGGLRTAEYETRLVYPEHFGYYLVQVFSRRITVV
jgi:hypothetical protein